MVNIKYTQEQYHCSKCKGQKTIYNPKALFFKCTLCDGKGYLTKKEKIDFDNEFNKEAYSIWGVKRDVDLNLKPVLVEIESNGKTKFIDETAKSAEYTYFDGTNIENDVKKLMIDDVSQKVDKNFAAVDIVVKKRGRPKKVK